MASERLPRTRRTVLVAGVVAALGCLTAALSLVGGSGGTPAAQDEDDGPPRGLPSRIAPTAAPGAPSFTVWAGPGCTSGRYSEQNRFRNGFAGWYTVRSGGFRDTSCDGSYTAVPMSGSPDRDGRNSATWSWSVGEDYDRCALAVFVPKGPRDIDVAGNPTVYRILSDPKDPASAYATFGVRQPAHRGTLVEVGTYPVRSAVFTVRLVDRGRDWGDSSLSGAHHAAAQLRLSCEPGEG
ncbi:adhesin [Streptomyces sp. SP18CS02]|uniref:adhesin n=1 Tax=Streptomyces sp. SP18CS02 TaxID=3002531 RepID=UPI002E75F696|nr:adhesin [Streptomyces sp. SP18CS02]MEE1755796.1 adhesin [Streptomyces sp. SP18CS02]